MQTRRSFLIAAAAVPLTARAGVAAGANTGANTGAADAPLKPRELYTRAGDFSDLAKSLEGQRITVAGFMAPPLKADMSFFVLTKIPMATCPFCETEAEWPDDILAVYTKRVVNVIAFNKRIQTRGILELGPLKDPDTGFLSMVRLSDATYG